MNDLERVLWYHLAGRPFLPRPRYLCLNATLRCDGRCGHCGIWRQKPSGPELTPEQVRKILAQSFFRRIESAWFTGGEPTLREDLGELARAVAGSLPSLSTLGMATNALEPERALDRVEAMSRALDPSRQGLFIQVSLDGAGEVHDRARNQPGAFQAAMKSLDLILGLKRSHPSLRLEAGLNCVIQPANVEGLAELHELARGKGLALTFNVALVTDQVYRNRDRAEALSLAEADRRKIIAFLDRVIPESPPALRYQHRILQAVLSGRPRPRRCLTLYSTININADGTWIPCPASSDFLPRSLIDADVEKLWKSPEARAMRSRVRRELCGSCMLSCSLGDSMPLGEWLRGGWG